jgi:hypothetical protein
MSHYISQHYLLKQKLKHFVGINLRESQIIIDILNLFEGLDFGKEYMVEIL